MPLEEQASAKTLLKSFLVSNYAFHDIFLNRDLFTKKLLPKRHGAALDVAVAEELYQQVVLWKQERVEDVVKRVEANFDAPEVELESSEHSDAAGDGSYIDTLTLNDLVDQMQAVSQILDSEAAKLEAQVAQELGALKETVGSLSDLKFGKTRFDESIKEATDELKQFEKLIG